MNKPKKIVSTWQVISYDVWGNAKEGWDVNQAFRRGEVEIPLCPEVCNPGTPREFISAGPSDGQIRAIFGIGRVKITTDGDDLTVYVTRARDSYPIGELRCASHSSLSPVKEKTEEKLVVNCCSSNIRAENKIN